MRTTCNLNINGRTVRANIGETLVDAGLGGWVVIPHDCCAGQCETCRVEVVSGAVDPQGTAEGRTVLACQATVEGPAEIRFEEVPVMTLRSGVVTGIAPLAADVVEVMVTLTAPMPCRPGQYLGVKFSGFPSRDLSPTRRFDGSLADDELVFQIRRYPGGLVSTQLGATIRPGHAVQVRGPYGHAYLRDGNGPIVLVAGGTGWAPIWSLACAARREQRHRDLVVIAGARDPDGLYMRRSLDRLLEDGVRDVAATAEIDVEDGILPGRPTHYLPSLGPEDTVYVAGPPGLVEAVKQKARIARARCYADPFLPGAQKLSLIDRVMQMLQRRSEAPAPAAAAAPGGLLRLGARRPQPVASAKVARALPRLRSSTRRPAR